MRILHISSARALGGGERHLIDLLNGLAARGHDLYVALTPASPLRAKLTALPAQKIITLRLRNALDLLSAIKLARFARERGIEIIHAHMARDYPLAAFAAWRTESASFIITRHVLFPLGKVNALTLAGVARVIAVSEPVAHTLRMQKLFPAHKISVIPNGIDVERFDHAARNFDRQQYRHHLQIRAPFLVGTVGELSRIKGQEDFVRAATILTRQRSDIDFVIAGEDASPTHETRKRIKHLIAKLNLHDRVHLVGHVEDVAPLLSSLDVFVSASHTESFGLAIAEAMASGAAVVATATDGAREIIEDGVTGRLVPLGDVATLAASINALLENGYERQRMAERASTMVRARFSIERMVDATEQVYREVLAAG